MYMCTVYSKSHMFEKIIPILTTLPMQGLKLLELFCVFLWPFLSFLYAKNYYYGYMHQPPSFSALWITIWLACQFHHNHVHNYIIQSDHFFCVLISITFYFEVMMSCYVKSEHTCRKCQPWRKNLTLGLSCQLLPLLLLM